MRAHKGMRFSATVDLDPEVVSHFARASGDENPLHHDDGFARASAYGQRIASGPHTSALMMAATASHFARGGPMVGLEFWFRFRRAVPARQRIRIDWLVIDVQAGTRPAGEVVELRGRLRTEDGGTAVGARGKILLQ